MAAAMAESSGSGPRLATVSGRWRAAGSTSRAVQPSPPAGGRSVAVRSSVHEAMTNSWAPVTPRTSARLKACPSTTWVHRAAAVALDCARPRAACVELRAERATATAAGETSRARSTSARATSCACSALSSSAARSARAVGCALATNQSLSKSRSTSFIVATPAPPRPRPPRHGLPGPASPAGPIVGETRTHHLRRLVENGVRATGDGGPPDPLCLRRLAFSLNAPRPPASRERRWARACWRHDRPRRLPCLGQDRAE